MIISSPTPFGPLHLTEDDAEAWAASQPSAFGFKIQVAPPTIWPGPGRRYRCALPIPADEGVVELLLRYREAMDTLQGCKTALECLAASRRPQLIGVGLPQLRERVGKCLAEYRDGRQASTSHG